MYIPILTPNLLFCLFLLFTACTLVRCDIARLQPDAIRLPDENEHPYLACNAEELARLRTAYAGTGADRAAIQEVIHNADTAMTLPIVFPPRGGQHNQWYQCPACETGLTTLDDTHHQCPGCKVVYSGAPYDDVIFARQHQKNLRAMLDTSWAFAITGKRQYAEYSAAILRGYAERYKKYPYHNSNLTQTGVAGGYLFEQTLTEANAMAWRIAPAYDLISASDVLTAADHQFIRAGLILPMLKNIERNQRGMSNWQTWHNAAMITGGMMLADPAWVRKALCDEKHGLGFQMGVSVGEEGLWYENSWGYHFYTLRALVAIVEAARHIGLNLWDDPRLMKMFTLPAKYVMADGMLPRFGDDVGTAVSEYPMVMEAAYHAGQSPAVLQALSDVPNFHSIYFGRKTGGPIDAPSLGSEVFPGAGHAILRGPAPAGLTAAFTFSPFGGFHGHFDKLSFAFFGYGQELGVDRGRAASQAYRLPIHEQWYRATISHNTVLVDRQSQQGVVGKLGFFRVNDSFTAVSATCDTAYEGVNHTRTLVMLPKYLLVIDDLVAESPRRFDWLYHNRGVSIDCDAATSPCKADKGFPGLQYVQQLRMGTTNGPLHVRFDGEIVDTHLIMDAQPGTQVLLGDGPGNSVLERIPLTMVKRQGTRVRFAAVLEPVTEHAPASVTAVDLEERGGKLIIFVRQGKLADEVILTPDKNITVQRVGKPL